MNERAEDDTFPRTFRDKHVLELPARVAFRSLHQIHDVNIFFPQFYLLRVAEYICSFVECSR